MVILKKKLKQEDSSQKVMFFPTTPTKYQDRIDNQSTRKVNKI